MLVDGRYYVELVRVDSCAFRFSQRWAKRVHVCQAWKFWCAELAAAMQFGDKDEHVYFWFPLLAGLSELTFDPRPDIRHSALEVGNYTLSLCQVDFIVCLWWQPSSWMQRSSLLQAIDVFVYRIIVACKSVRKFYLTSMWVAEKDLTMTMRCV